MSHLTNLVELIVGNSAYGITLEEDVLFEFVGTQRKTQLEDDLVFTVGQPPVVLIVRVSSGFTFVTFYCVADASQVVHTFADVIVANLGRRDFLLNFVLLGAKDSHRRSSVVWIPLKCFKVTRILSDL